MSENQTTLSQKIKPYVEENHQSIFNFAKKAGIQTATFNYMMVNNSFRVGAIELLGAYDEKIIDITINHLLSLKKKNDLPIENSPLLQRIQELEEQINNLQSKMISNNQLLIDCQQKIINQK